MQEKMSIRKTRRIIGCKNPFRREMAFEHDLSKIHYII